MPSENRISLFSARGNRNERRRAGTPRPMSLIAAIGLGGWTYAMAPAVTAGTVRGDGTFGLDYRARTGEENRLEVRIIGQPGQKGAVMELSDLAGIDGCTPVPGNAVSVRCDASQLAVITVSLRNRADRFSVIGPVFLINVNYEVVGGIGNDVMLGGPEFSVFLGRAGDDELRGGPAADSLDGDAGNDKIFGDEGDDGISGGSGADELDGGSGNDGISGGKGNDSIKGGPGEDRIDAGGGDDTIDAVDGERDEVVCGRGDDKLTADAIDEVDATCGSCQSTAGVKTCRG